MMSAMTLTEFLLARIAEDEAAARGADGPTEWMSDHLRSSLDVPVYGDHPWRARMLAECEAKRRIVDLHQGEHECVGEKYGRLDCVYVAPGFMHELDPTLRILALPYADHPEYSESWRP
jgi:hypothetical protein